MPPSASQSVTPGLVQQTGVVGELVGELIRVDFELRDVLQLHVAIQLQTARRLTDTVAATHMECVVFAVLLSTTARMAFLLHVSSTQNLHENCNHVYEQIIIIFSLSPCFSNSMSVVRCNLQHDLQ